MRAGIDRLGAHTAKCGQYKNTQIILGGVQGKLFGFFGGGGAVWWGRKPGEKKFGKVLLLFDNGDGVSPEKNS